MADQNFTLTQEYLQSIFDYREGELFYKVAKGKFKIGDKAGTVGKRYKQICINKKIYYLHRVIFMMHHGYMPEFIDHKDRDPLNSKIENLRPSTLTQNQYNRNICKRNTTGFKGISLSKKSNKYMVRLSVNGHQKYFGEYFDIEVAKFVLNTMQYKYHKDFSVAG